MGGALVEGLEGIVDAVVEGFPLGFGEGGADVGVVFPDGFEPKDRGFKAGDFFE